MQCMKESAINANLNRVSTAEETVKHGSYYNRNAKHLMFVPQHENSL